MATPLPDRPDLDQLKNQAKDLHKGHKAGDPQALAAHSGESSAACRIVRPTNPGLSLHAQRSAARGCA